jgi:acetyl-CoA C-acetyltransferase
MTDPIVIVSAARTPMGSFQGDFSALAAHDLGGAAIRAAVGRAGIHPALVTEVLFGNCLMAGQGQAPARQAAFKGGLPQERGRRHPQQDVRLGHARGDVRARHAHRRQPRRAGCRRHGKHDRTRPTCCKRRAAATGMGHDRIFDHMMLDGLEDAYEPGRSMGTFGEDCAAKYSFTRQQQDNFAMASVQRAQAAIKNGAFTAEIAPVTVKDRKGERVVDTDEGPGKINIDKIPTLKPAFRKDGTVTAAGQLQHQRRRRRDGVDARQHGEEAGLHSRWRASSATPRMRRSRSGSAPRPSAPPRRRWPRPAGRWATWICGKSTRPLPWCPWR